MSKTLPTGRPLLVFATPNRDHDARSGRKSLKKRRDAKNSVVQLVLPGTLVVDLFDSIIDLFDSICFVWLSC
jgi:hypothetical protein